MSKKNVLEVQEKKWLITTDLPCLKCGYNMRELEGPIVSCPECGYDNDITQPKLWFCHNVSIDQLAKEHWAVLAAFTSLLFVPALLLLCTFTPAVLRSTTAPAFVIILGTVIPVLCNLGLAALWIWSTLRWFKSTPSKFPTTRVLIELHVALWIFFVGILYTPTCFFLQNNPSLSLHHWLAFLLVPASILIIYRVKLLLKNQSNTQNIN